MRHMETKPRNIFPALQTFCAVLFAMTGNAQILGVDVTLFIIGPACVFMVFFKGGKFSDQNLPLVAVIIFATGIFSLRSASFVELQGYSLWPLKALLTAFFFSSVPARLDRLQGYIIFVLVLALFVTTEDVLGRSYGFFGPNMLYRFYGLLLLVSLFLLLVDNKRMVWLVFALFSLWAIYTTGSAGGVLLVSIGLALFIKPKFSYVVLGCLAAFLLYLIIPLIGEFQTYNRILDKLDIDAIQNSIRYIGISDILIADIGIFGNNYEFYNHIWTIGYEYPHNVFVELIAFYGFLSIPVIFILIWSFLISWRHIWFNKNNIIELCFICIFVGSTVSGELSDNYGVVGLAIAIIFSHIKMRGMKLRIL